MLLILYGATAEMGYISRKYLTESGFALIEKYSYAPQKPEITTFYGVRNYVDRDTFYENTDSLFRYETGGIRIGFNQQQISDAVCNKSNALLTLSASNTAFLAEIKRIYAENVCLIYAYLDDDTLKKTIGALPGISEEEVQKRIAIGADVKKNYANNPALFDRVVIYGGENSVFDTDNLLRQYRSIIDSVLVSSAEEKRYCDVFLTCSAKDRAVCEEIKSELSERGISVIFEEAAAFGADWAANIADAIQHAKAVVPVVTENALGSRSFSAELKASLAAATNYGTAVIPFYLNNSAAVADNELCKLLSAYSGIAATEEDVGQSAAELAERLKQRFSADSKLRELAVSADNYLCLKMYRQAKECQKAHMQLCDQIYKASDGAHIAAEACLLSRIKLASILLDMDLPKEALEYVTDALTFTEIDVQMFDALSAKFAACCARCNMGEAEVRELIKKRLAGIRVIDGERGVLDFERCANALTEKFIAEKSIVKSVIVNAEALSKDAGQSRIARYGELVMELFDALLENEADKVSDYDLTIGYERILNYCKHIGLKGRIADKCITRIAELKAGEESKAKGDDSEFRKALKIYLGQALPMSGEYDVFLSYKSEDVVLAQKVYDYLVQIGKEVFFSKETLPQLGESEYEEMIFNAIDRSKHMVLVGSNPEYLKTPWVKDEWSTFNNEIREGRKDGNLVLLLSDDISADKGSLPVQLRQKEIVKMSEFRSKLLSYLR